MTRIGLLASSLAFVGLAGAAPADEKVGIRFKLGYYFGQGFRLQNGDTGSLNGPQFSADIPLTQTRGLQLFVTPSLVLGGGLGHGGDTDGKIFTFMLSARQNLAKDGSYWKIAAGVGHTESKNTVNRFRDANDFVGSVSFGTRLGVGPKFAKKLDPGLEITAYLSRQRQLGGISLGLTLGF